MHIHFIRSQALSALKKLQPALPRDNLIPQLSGIHLEADAERKEVTATARSTALAARISFPSEVEEAVFKRSGPYYVFCSVYCILAVRKILRRRCRHSNFSGRKCRAAERARYFYARHIATRQLSAACIPGSVRCNHDHKLSTAGQANRICAYAEQL